MILLIPVWSSADIAVAFWWENSRRRSISITHCTGNRGKCPEGYTPAPVLTHHFLQILEQIIIPQAILDWLEGTVLESDRTERASRERQIKRLWADHERLNARIEAMYMDKLDGRITAEFFDQRSAAWRQEQEAIVRRIDTIQKSAPVPVDTAIDVLQLTSEACRLFEQQSAAEQRRFLQLLVKKAEWRDGKLRATLFEPFEVLRHSNQESQRKERDLAGSGRDSEIWLPGMDSNHVCVNLTRFLDPVTY
jgi:site-specific DNA recombinase